MILQLRTLFWGWQYAAVVIAIDTRVPAQMADEPARAVLASYVSHNYKE